MASQTENQAGFPWLESFLALAALALVAQLVPTSRDLLLSIIDIRQWSRYSWIWLNGIIVVFLITLRIAPGVMQAWHDRRRRRAAENTAKKKQDELKEQRETLARLQESRKRRMY